MDETAKEQIEAGNFPASIFFESFIFSIAYGDAKPDSGLVTVGGQVILAATHFEFKTRFDLSLI